MATQSPIFQPAYTPVYSNEAFSLLGIALGRIAGTTLEDVLNESLVTPLSLSGTYYSAPSTITSHDVIPENPVVSGWTSEFGPTAA